MSIKVVDDIPETLQEKRQSYREKITLDILEALEQRIECFEFEGDYNWKYLAQYAREEARRIFRKNYYLPAKNKVITELKEKYNEKYIFPKSDWEYKNRFINVVNRKGEDRQHVYVTIDYEFADNFYKTLLEDTDAHYQSIRKERERQT